jgi:cytochrome c-type biogenesis protein CcmH/NrfF
MRRVVGLLILFCMVGSLMAADNNARYENLGGKIMCTCGCGQMLLKCNHVGCPNSEKMIHQLRTQVASTNDDEAVLNFFRNEWGVTTVVEPGRHGFELLAWILPFAGLGVGILLLVLVARKWRLHSAGAGAGNAPLDPHLEALRARARQETEI